MKADILREKFLEFFRNKKHKIVDSDSLVPQADPTVLFTPAGMNQFKKEFMGLGRGILKRAATAQRCLRTDDLDKVGRTCGHHTFFEMLGNFSFGDYFKQEAISFAWEFLTRTLKIPAGRLWVSVHSQDQESYSIWKDKIKIEPGRILRLGDKENFWPSEAREKGPNGPCGPCSEIFFDWGKQRGCRRAQCNPACNCGRFVEVWNLVFTQFDRKPNGRLDTLPQKNIDTGMGLERLCAIMQGVYSNFETDLFKPIIEEIVSGIRYQVSGIGQVYAVADHIRAITFAIYDGVLPSNEERGYVVRKLIRKSSLHLRNLGLKAPFLYKLAPEVACVMRRPYPDLFRRKENISQIILSEERAFLSILDSSASIFEDKFRGFLQTQRCAQEAGEIAFYLYDTFGIPLEMSQKFAKEKGFQISEEVFECRLSQQRQRSKEKSLIKKEVFGDSGFFDLPQRKTRFLGYKNYENEAKILRIVKDGRSVKKITQPEAGLIILDATVFYPESGGQIADIGQISKRGGIFEVEYVYKRDSVIIHKGRVKKGSFSQSDTVFCKIGRQRRLAIARNHTATHILQAVLRQVLGEHIRQFGSLVAEDRLRFDFTHFESINQQILYRIEELVNQRIRDNVPVVVQEVSLSQARKKKALAFFDSKYGKKVRLVSIGDYSRELCAGTHLKATGQIGLFKIISQESVAQGIRRIEAQTGESAYQGFRQAEEIICAMADILKVPPEQVVSQLEKQLMHTKDLERQLQAFRHRELIFSLEGAVNRAKNIATIKFIYKFMPGYSIAAIRSGIDFLKQRLSEGGIIVLSTLSEEKFFLAVGITSDLTQKGWDAAALVKKISVLFGGSGGGRKDFAQSGGRDTRRLEDIEAQVEKIILQTERRLKEGGIG
jgi:alanyl-tRNA synthetase